MSHRKLGRSGDKADAVLRALKQRNPRLVLRDAGPRSGRKISECLLELVEPHREDEETTHSLNLLLTLGMLAWNAGKLSEPEVQEMLDTVITKNLSPGNVEADRGLRAVAMALIERKRQLFPDDTRSILSYDMVKTKGSYHITAVALRTEGAESAV